MAMTWRGSEGVRRRHTRIVMVGMVGCMTSAGCADDGGPRLDAVTPAAASRGATVMISGQRLCGVEADCTTAAGEIQLGLRLPTVRAVVVSYSDTLAEVAIPTIAPVGRTVLVATVAERSSNALEFEVLP